MNTTIRLTALVGLVALAISGRAARAENREREAAAAVGDAERKPRPRITVSTKTTVVTSPLRKDGYPDYCAALNEIARHGVTRENNAAVLLWQAFGPAEMTDGCRAELFGSPPVPNIPAQGHYFVPFDEYARRIQESEELLSGMPSRDEDELGEPCFTPEDVARVLLAHARRRPWLAWEYPAVAGWLKQNEKPLALVTAASQRPRMYCPLESGLVFASQLPHLALIRGTAEALSVRATHSLGAGKVEDAWQDLLTIHRLARLVAQGPTLIESAVARALDRMAWDGAVVLLSTTDLTAEQARRFQADLQGLSPMPSLAEKIDVGERYGFLDAICCVAKDPVHSIELYASLPGDTDTALGSVARGLTKASIRIADGFLVDWDDALRVGNRWFDRAVATARKPTFRERWIEAERMERDLRESSRRIRTLVDNPAEVMVLSSSPSTFGQMLGEFGVCLVSPSAMSEMRTEAQGAARFSMTQVAVALARYRAEHGRYPGSLAALRPRYVQQVPKDPFTGGDLRYQPRPSGYLLYTVGPNGRDDAGRNWEEEYLSEFRRTGKADGIPDEADDLAIAMPLGATACSRAE